MPARKLLFVLSLFAGVSAGVINVASAENWARFRGPNGTGISDDKSVPVEISDSKNVLWKTSLPGGGHSSPIVWNGRVFVQAASADGKQRTLVCADLNTGKVLWQKASPGSTAHTHKLNSLASCTAATDGQRVYMPFWDGNDLSLTAYDFDGNLLWKRDLGSFKSQHGPGHAPMLVDGKVILANDQDGSSTLVALNTADGNVAWDVKRDFNRACYSTPMLLDRPDGSQELLVASTVGLSGYDIKTGAENWKWRWEKHVLRTVGSPIFHNGMVFIGSGDGSGARHAVAVKLDRHGSAVEPSLVWEEKKAFPYVPTMLTRGDYLFVINDGGIASCHIAKTGEKVWQERLGGTFFSSPIMVDGKIYALNDGGDVFVFPAEPTYNLLWSNNVGESVKATPAVSDGKLVVRGATHLMCFGK